MEDYYIIELNLVHHPNVGLFGIFDGHNGTAAARWFSENISNVLDNLSSFTSEEIKKAMIDLDEEYLRVTGNITSGTTATLILVEKTDDVPDKSHKVTICHIGDSRFYIGKYTSSTFILRTEDHKPSTEEEKKRIISAGGLVINGRVDSILAVSRALGDHCYKDNRSLPPQTQKVIAVPDISVSYVGNQEYLFLCSDGVIEPRRARDGTLIFQFFNERLQNLADTAQLQSDLMRELLQSGARDNMSAMIIEFKNGQDYNCGHEFVAGEYYEEFGNTSYMDAYRSNCEMNGKTLEEVRSLWYARKEQLERKKEEETDSKKND